MQNVLQLRCEPMDRVRIGFIGLGVRAKRAVERMMHIEGAEVIAICDLVAANVDEAQQIILSHGGVADTFCEHFRWLFAPPRLAQRP